MKKITNLAKTIIRKQTGSNRRRSSAGRFCTSSAGAVTSLILVVALSFLSSVLLNLIGLTGVTNTYADSSLISLNVSSDMLDFNILPVSANGSFAKSSDLTVGVTFSGLGGYTLSVRAANSTDLVNGNNTLPSLPSAISESDYSADNATGANYNNTWGYKPSKLNSSDNTNYLPSPSLEGDIIEKTNTDGDGSTTNYTISLGARVNVDTAPGDYANTFIIAVVANNTCNPNAAGILDAYCMQDMNDSVISSMVTGKQYKLVDNRDNKVYYVAKMKDGRVWMTQNLDLDLINDTESADYTALTSNNTDLNTYGTGAYVDGYTCSNTETTTNCTADGEVITWVPVNATTSSGWIDSRTVPYSYDNGDTYYYTDTEGDTTTYTSEADCNAAHDDGTCDHYHSGNYYNASAAIASNDSSSITSYTLADNSICPKGWRLPNAASSNGYGDANQTWYAEGITTSISASSYRYDAYAANGYNKLSNAPLYMTRSGFRNSDNTPQKVSESGYLMTGSVTNGAYVLTYQFTPAYAYPYTQYAITDGNNLNRSVQFPVRCLARQTSVGDVTITFNANGGTGTMASQIISANSSRPLRNNTFTREGYVFNGWNTASDGSGIHYNDAVTYYAAANTVSNNITLYAEWLPAHTITVNADENIKVSVDNGANWTEAGGTTTLLAGEGQSIVLKAMDDTSGTVFDNWIKDTGVGDFMNTTWRNSSTKTTTFVVGSGDATITANGTTTYTTIGTTTVNMQDITACPDWLATGTVYQVTDTRDNDTYNVAKLADGKCWMLENMRLDPTDTNTATLTSANTNATNELLVNYESNVVAKTSSFSSYTIPTINVAHIEDTASYGDGDGKVGVYYNYCAASAGEICTNSENTTNATYDICPKGWRMPAGSWVDNTTGFGEYQELRNKYSSVADYKNALRTPLSGYFNGSTQYDLGTGGYFWSSSFYGGNYSYRLYVTATGASPQNYVSRNLGFSMRCVMSD